MRRTQLALLLLLLSTVAINAQEVPEVVVSWDVEFFAAGVDPATATPTQSANFLKSAAQCGQPVVTPSSGAIINPTVIRLTDPNNAAQDCILGPNTAGTLLSVPIGSGYRATAKAIGATLTSGRSAASNPFDRVVIPVAPSVPTSVRVHR